MLKLHAVLRETLGEWQRDRVPRLAAALAFYTVFSAAPVLVIVIAVAGLIFGEQTARGQLFGQLRTLVGPDAALALAAILENTRQPGANLLATLLGLVTLLLGATGVFAELQDALNTLWGVSAERQRNGWLQVVRDRFAAFAMVLGIAALLVVSLLASTLLSALTGLAPEAISGLLAAPLDLGLSFVLTVGLFAAIFKVLPDVSLQWRDVWLGSILTAALFIAGKSLIGLYLGRSGITSPYGAAGSLALILLWVFYSAQVFFLGAEFTKVYSRHHTRGAPPPVSPPAVLPSKHPVAPFRRALAAALGAFTVLVRLRR